MDSDGYIRFRCKWNATGPLSPEPLEPLNRWRARLYLPGLIGAYSNGVGYGNISQRIGGLPQFVITGSATGNLESLTGYHYSVVREYDIDSNFLECDGPIRASSESLTHGAIYLAEPEANGVIHVHNLELWERLIWSVPTTNPDAEYGTPEMAREVMRVVRENQKRGDLSGIIVMAGHKEGIISYGRSLDEAGELILEKYLGR